MIYKTCFNNIIDIIQKKSSLEYNFERLSIKWNGLDPSLIFKNISLHKEDINQHYLDSEKIILRINFLKSLSTLKIVPEEINLVIKILLYAGLSIKSADIAQLADAKETQKIQQEKS